jgi:hypothetical protein
MSDIRYSMPLESERNDQYGNDNNKNKDNLIKSDNDKISDIDKVGIHSATDSARHLERAQQKEPIVTEGSQKGLWQIRHTENNGDEYNDNNNNNAGG